jgi:transposase
MEQISTIGLDIAKTVFQVHGIDGSGEPVVRRQLRRRQVLPFFGRLSPCLAQSRHPALYERLPLSGA